MGVFVYFSPAEITVSFTPVKSGRGTDHDRAVSCGSDLHHWWPYGQGAFDLASAALGFGHRYVQGW